MIGPSYVPLSPQAPAAPYNSRNDHVEPADSIDSFTTTASIIGGLNPIWSFDNENPFANNLTGQYFNGNAQQNSKQPQVGNNSSSLFIGSGQHANILEDESILSLSTGAYSNQTLPHSQAAFNETNELNTKLTKLNMNTKPIGYERHEKQIHSNQNNQSNTTAGLDEFSCNSFNYLKIIIL